MKSTFSILILAGLLLLAPALLAQMEPAGMGRVSISNYTLPGYGPNGALQWLLMGRRAEIQGNTVLLEDDNVADTTPGVQLVYFDKDNNKIVIESPGCEFNRLTKVGTSTAPVRVYNRAAGWEITGVGYEFWPDERRLRILSRVKMTFKDLRQVVSSASRPAEKSADKPMNRTPKSEGALPHETR